jgi:hypothetical protein
MTVQLDYFAFAGGINEVTPAIAVPAGQLFFGQNYVPDINGGYRLVGGYERFDGRPRPSEAVYRKLACTLSSTPAVGAALTIGAETARFVQLVEGGMVVTDLSGEVTPGDVVSNGSPIGVLNSNLNLLAPTVKEDAEFNLAAGNVLRADIEAVPGSGPVRGIWQYGGKVYAFRDDSTQGRMYESSSSGWTAISLGEEVPFENAAVGVVDNATLTQGSVTATVARVVVETGSLLSGVNTGRLILTGRAGGNFAAGAATAGAALDLTGAQTAIALSKEGDYVLANYNFYGQQATEKMYGCNGKDRAFEFDGTVFVPISTKAAQDKPAFILGHRRYLFVAQGSSVMFSSIGEPTRWVAAEGAGEVAVGDTITNLVSMPGEALGIICNNSSHALTGADPTTWSLQVIRSDTGGRRKTAVVMSDVFLLDDRGVISLKAADAYGNFLDAVLSRMVQFSINDMKRATIGAYPNRSKGLYVLLGNDGSAVVMGVAQGKVNGFTTLKYPINPVCVCSEENADGAERILVGAQDGFVYEIDRGSSFDGLPMEAYCKVFFSHSKAPRMRKRYRRAVLDIDSNGYSEISFIPEFSYGTIDIPTHRSQQLISNGLGGAWDVSLWDRFAYDGAETVSQPNLSVEGTGVNIALLFYMRSALDAGHVLQGAMVHYTPRRLER